MNSDHLKEINEYLQRRLQIECLVEVSANEAARWLDEAALLEDSPTRPGRNLRNLLRAGSIGESVQRPPTKNGRWFILRACPFCRKLRELENQSEPASFADAYPSAEGHQLVVPARHLERIEELSPEEWRKLFKLVREVATKVSAEPGVDGVNIGVNSREAAGQTVGHVHVHVIPRRAGDVADPRGGVRWVLPETADYWSERDS